MSLSTLSIKTPVLTIVMNLTIVFYSGLLDIAISAFEFLPLTLHGCPSGQIIPVPIAILLSLKLRNR
jgi:hypothetical protein